ncbi:MAG: zinc ribbon domain-containing protein [Bryobacteraceae bacterium]
MTYEYKCNDCGKSIEIRASMAEKERGLRVECPACGSTRTTQVFTALRVLARSGRGGTLPPSCGGPGSGCCG